MQRVFPKKTMGRRAGAWAGRLVYQLIKLYRHYTSYFFWGGGKNHLASTLSGKGLCLPWLYVTIALHLLWIFNILHLLLFPWCLAHTVTFARIGSKIYTEKSMFFFLMCPMSVVHRLSGLGQIKKSFQILTAPNMYWKEKVPFKFLHFSANMPL